MATEKAPDLAFPCGGTRFVIEHTAIGAFEGQRAWQETGRLICPLPESLALLPQCRQEQIRKAFDAKLGKLAAYADRLRTQGEDATSILILEFEDYLHSGPRPFLEALHAVIPSYRERLPDEIHLVGTRYLAQGNVSPSGEAEMQVPAGGEMFALDLVGYRTGDERPGFFGPLCWWQGEEDWFWDPTYVCAPRASGGRRGSSLGEVRAGSDG
jgi:hypothetical protein